MIISLLENNYYSIEFLKEELGCSYEEILSFCEKKRITQWDDSNKSLAFRFVGYLFHCNVSLYFLPKYLKSNEELNQKEYMALLLQVLHKYQKSLIDTEYDNEVLEELDDKQFHLLGTISYLLQHYIEFGLYLKEHEVQDTLFDGEIDWQTTIDEKIAYLTSDDTPVYLDLVKSYIEVNLSAKITDLHKFILNQCSKLISLHQLDLIFSWPQLLFETIYDWDNNLDEAVYIIDQEMLIEFQDQKLRLLKNLKLFIGQLQSMKFTQDQFLIGTKYFYHVWEKCCSDVLGHDSSIQQYITKPAWNIDNNSLYSEKTLRPDFLKHHVFNNSDYLLIFDAKYYTPHYHAEFSNVIKSAPGVGDITKQYMYQKALEEYAVVNEINTIYNAFLIPTFENGIKTKGSVQFDFISTLPPINLIYLNAESLFTNYINNEHWDINYLENLLNELKSI